eukprot:scaffold107589_cov17-Tisochrysis_lutea.AAC.1
MSGLAASTFKHVLLYWLPLLGSGLDVWPSLATFKHVWPYCLSLLMSGLAVSTFKHVLLTVSLYSGLALMFGHLFLLQTCLASESFSTDAQPYCLPLLTSGLAVPLDSDLAHASLSCQTCTCAYLKAWPLPSHSARPSPCSSVCSIFLSHLSNQHGLLHVEITTCRLHVLILLLLLLGRELDLSDCVSITDAALTPISRYRRSVTSSSPTATAAGGGAAAAASFTSTPQQQQQRLPEVAQPDVMGVASSREQAAMQQAVIESL